MSVHGRVWLAIVLGLAFLIYAPSACNGFTYDDESLVKVETKRGRNPMVGELRPLLEYFTRPYGYGLEERSQGFRPVTVLSFALTHAAFAGPAPGSDPPLPHHAWNVLLHVLATAVAWLITRALTGPGIAPLLAALVFGVHAIRSEVVISIVGRAEILAFAFGGLALLSWCGGLAREGGARYARLAAASVLLFLAFGSKESGLAWAPMLPVFSLAARRLELGGLRRQLLPALLVIAPPLVVFLLLRSAAVGAEVGEVEASRAPLYYVDSAVRVRTALVILALAAMKTVLPVGLSSDYGAHVFDYVASWVDPRFLGSLVLLLALVAGGFLALRRRPLLFLAMAFFFGFSFLTSNVPIAIATSFGERLLYTPAFGLSLVIAWLAVGPCAAAGRLRVLVAVALLWSGVNAALAVTRCFDWRDDPTLFVTDAARQPRSLWLNVAAARALRDRDEVAAAERHLEQALRVQEDYAVALIDLANLHMGAGRFDSAESLLRRAIASREVSEEERVTLRQNLAVVHVQLGRDAAAKELLEAIVAADPTGKPAKQARLELIWIAHRASDVASMERLVRDAARQREDDDPPLQVAAIDMARGVVAHARGRYSEAARVLGEALRFFEQNAQQMIRVEAVLAQIDSLRRTGARNEALRRVRHYLKWPAMPARSRPRFEALQRELGG